MKTRLLKLVKTYEKQLEGKAASYDPRAINNGEVISSHEHNFDLLALLEELRSIYAQASSLAQIATKHQNVINNSFNTVKSGLLKATNDVKVHTFLRTNPEYDDVRFVDFNAARNDTIRGPAADVDVSTRSCKLAIAAKRAVELTYPSKASTNVNITHIGAGRTGTLIQGFEPNKMLDRDDSTFWADLILTDGPITQTYGTSNGETRTCQGLITEIEIVLSETSPVNSIRILPFSEYPISIIDVAYKEAQSETGWIQIPDFSEPLPGLDWVEYQFLPIRAAVMRCTILQENYVRGIYHLPANMVRNTNILEHAVADVYLDNIGTGGLSASDAARVATDPELLNWIEKVNEFTDSLSRAALPQERVREIELTKESIMRLVEVISRPDVTESATLLESIGVSVEKEDEKLLEIKTTEYLVGIRSLETLMVQYAPVSYYASPKFSPPGTPIEVSIITNEKHPILEDENGSYRLTSIDYDIDFGEGLRFPIAPVNYEYIDNVPIIRDEVVPIDRHSRIGYSRFLPNNLSVSVRRNGVLVPVGSYDFVIDLVRNVGNLIISSDFSPTAVYTITYEVDSEATRILLPSTLYSSAIRVPEVFNGTDESSHIRVSYVPYVEYEIVNGSDFTKRETQSMWDYTPDNASDSTTIDNITYSEADNNTYEPLYIEVDNIRATNITNYQTGAQPAFTDTDQHSKVYEYFQVGKDIYFNTPITNKQISVTYRWLVQYVQLVATLRCFKQAGTTATPKIEDFHIRLRTSPL